MLGCLQTSTQEKCKIGFPGAAVIHEGHGSCSHSLQALCIFILLDAQTEHSKETLPFSQNDRDNTHLINKAGQRKVGRFHSMRHSLLQAAASDNIIISTSTNLKR